MSTDLDQRVIDAAGHAMAEIKKGCNPHEAQIAISLMCVWLCSQYEININIFAEVLTKNMLETGRDPILMNIMVERLHKIMKEEKILH